MNTLTGFSSAFEECARHSPAAVIDNAAFVMRLRGYMIGDRVRAFGLVMEKCEFRVINGVLILGALTWQTQQTVVLRLMLGGFAL
jgi:hypothetical protein